MATFIIPLSSNLGLVMVQLIVQEEEKLPRLSRLRNSES